MNPVKVGIIGCGIISERHLQAYQANAELGEVVACCDIDPQRAKVRAEQAGGARIYIQWEDLLSDPQVEAVDICLPHYLHHPVVLQSLKAGKHVLCEKPIATTLEQADEMIQWARQTGKIFAVGEGGPDPSILLPGNLRLRNPELPSGYPWRGASSLRPYGKQRIS